jgi:putative SOS response-associated peptidase YedK
MIKSNQWGIGYKDSLNMCGRFVGFRKLEELEKYFPIDRSNVKAAANYNIAPSQEVLALIRRDKKNVLDLFHWGLVPFWAKDVSMGNRLINARAESVASKPSFRAAFAKRRCLILADGFYEWKSAKGKKQPFYLTLPDETPFGFAGLWETWDNKGKADHTYRSCTIITKPASESVRPVHHRMPVIVSPEKYAAWLDPDNQDAGELGDILQNWTISDLRSQPVSKQVNNARNNEAANIKPLRQTEISF